MKQITCPHCKLEINVGSLMAQARWDATTAKEKKAQGKRLAESRRKLSTAKGAKSL